MPDIDLKRLKRAVGKRLAGRPAGIGPAGRPVTGSKAVIRQHFDALTAMHSAGATWVDIAAELASQNVTQGNGEPISARRLMSLIANVRAERLKSMQVTKTRAARRDLAPAASSTDKPDAALDRKPLKLSPDLSRLAPVEDPGHATEAQIRQAAFDKHAGLFKKDGDR